VKRTRINRVSTTTRARRTAWTAFRREVWARDNGACVMGCGPIPLEFAEIHHRLLKSRGGKDTHENTITLCGWHHHQAVHKYPTWATVVGLMVPAGFTPDEWPVLLDVSHGRWSSYPGARLLWMLPKDGQWALAAPHADQHLEAGPWEFNHG
jgi:hypothetical protein